MAEKNRKNVTEAPAVDSAAQTKCDRIISEYTYAITHDLNAPLRHISQYGTLLKEEMGDRLGPTGTLYVNKLIESTERLRQLVNDLLSYAHVIHLKEKKQCVDLHKKIAEAKEKLNASIEKSHAIIKADNLPTIEAYPFCLQEIFYHLLKNAIDYRGAEAPVITITCIDKNTYYLFSVRDNGTGVAAKSHTNIFRALKRLHSQDEIAGSGLGLAICEKAVEAHGGRIWVESGTEPPSGATFLFTIPYAKSVSKK